MQFVLTDFKSFFVFDHFVLPVFFSNYVEYYFFIIENA